MSIESPSPLAPDLAAIACQAWDAVVVGAGPAGALAARELARVGASVLLVDQAAFPRRKVCGGCLNARALAALSEAGLARLPDRLGAVPLRELRVRTAGHVARIALPPSAALTSGELDAAGVTEAAA
ncbi:MAG: FAD-dependent monooxygenase, partial [bacterium]|nr:FAD-dependent monooxygenase [bacterium]